ncbi:MAG: transcriptional repressor [Candidatus Thiodiazotropha sp. (ex Myrtea spinifera)]|nr:transcriptional repressor [Candidatus Thiodiazotropha sp. (ex Myrtea spinifera)]MCU7828542.1 transcriptional repressor [Candidatus Thiodiazotropha sp. (ex Myrtea sp. 'scaly one' KF741663)]
MTPNTHDQLLKKKQVEQMLAEHGIFVTAQRRIIAEALFARNQHITADQLLDLVNKNGTKVSKATIYNSLGLFADKGLVREIHINASKTFYDSNASRHHHFYNVDTGDLIDMKERLVPLFLQSDLPDGTVMETADVVIRVRNQSP